MNEKIKNLKIIPVAYVYDLKGIIFIIEIKTDGKIQYAEVLPPKYEITERFSKNLLISAITKHNYIPYKGKIYPFENYRENLKLLQEKLIKKKK